MQDKAINSTLTLRNWIKCLILSAFVAFSGQALQAQSTPDDIVYLKNGSVLRGKITSIKQDTSLTIQILGSNNFVVKWEDMDRFEMGGTPPSVTSAPPERNSRPERFRAPRRKTWELLQPRENGYYGRAEVGIIVGQTSFFSTSLGMTFHTAHGYRFSRGFGIGFGTGLDRYTYEGTLLPLHADFRGEMGKASWGSPFWFASGGWALGLPASASEIYQGGFSGLAGIGLSCRTRYKFTLDVTLGYKVQQTRRRFEEVVWDWNTGQQIPTGNVIDLRTVYNRMALGFGVGF